MPVEAPEIVYPANTVVGFYEDCASVTSTATADPRSRSIRADSQLQSDFDADNDQKPYAGDCGSECNGRAGNQDQRNRLCVQ
jgi:hypothetical protein